MRLKFLLLLWPLLTATPAAAQDGAQVRGAGAEPRVVRLCELLSADQGNERGAQAVSITAGAFYDFEYGYFLSDSECTSSDVFSGTGALKIELPPNTSIGAFPELQKLASQEFLAANVGRRIHCDCAGMIDYSHGYPHFVLSSARVWASN